MGELPNEAERLLGVSARDFVAERDRLAKELRQSGRADDAAVVAQLRKPSAPVLAVNRAARDRPQATRAAVDAAKLVERAHGGGDPEAFRKAVRQLEEAIELLGEVAVAHVSPPGTAPSDAMRRRVYDLLRRAVASEDTRDALSRGALLEEPPVAGFASLTSVAATAARGRRAAKRPEPLISRQEDERRKRLESLREELARAEKALAEAERGVAAAERERARAERGVVAIRAKLDRLA